jgi:cytochrome c
MVRLLIAGAFVSSLVAGSACSADIVSAGRSVFASQCSICHSNARNGPVIQGPPLFGVVGRKAGTVNGFAYSPAMRAAGFDWTPERLRAYLPGPRDYLPGVRMSYAGLKNPSQLDALIAYLGSLK